MSDFFQENKAMKKIISVILAVCLGFSAVITAGARLLGDVNKDGEVNSSDALEILTYTVGKNDGLDLKISDVDADGKIDSGDALVILQISVGSYPGELTVEDEKKNLKEELVDPVLKTRRYKLSTEITSDGKAVPADITVRGSDICCEMKDSTYRFRLLILDGKTYLVLPDLKLYSPMEISADGLSSVSPTECTFVKSENKKIDGKDYILETYSVSDGSTSVYYFSNNKWVRTDTTDVQGNTKVQNITGLTGDIDESLFSFKGMKKVDLSKYIK